MTYQLTDNANVPAAAAYMAASLVDDQDALTRAYFAAEHASMTLGLATLLHATWVHLTGSEDGLREWLEVLVLADRETPQSGVDT